MKEGASYRKATLEERCSGIRGAIEQLKGEVASLHNDDRLAGETCMLEGANVPEDQLSNMRANITLVFRHLEDARMRTGKIMQAADGGVSILDKG